MGRIKIILLGALGLCLVVSLGAWHSARALDARSGPNAVVGKNEVVDSSLYAAGQSVIVEGTVKGDVFCAGQTVEITGHVEGDVLCGGQSVRVSGVVDGNVRAGGQTVTLSGSIGHSATVAGQSVNIDSTTSVGRDLSVFGQSVHLEGTVARDTLIVGQNADVSGTTTRNLDVVAQDVTIVNGAHIGGAFTYTSRNMATVAPGAMIAGATTHKEPPVHNRPTRAALWGGSFALSVYWFISMVVLGAAGLAAAPILFRRSEAALQKHPWATLGIGVAALFVTPIAALLLAITIIGVPLAIVLILCWIVSLIVSPIFAGYALGMGLAKAMHWQFSFWRHFIPLILGLLVIALLWWVPLLGGLVMFAAVVFGLGALLQAKFARGLTAG